ncbi:transmembrane protein, putative (macronuclear) [Tetrahymena thermophila SB210]|uniref:Transmembrane protein, putative n=1 Tax=Tetrahymena thermophila (strain SB210) TaxID=312017 RepID=Q22WF8_TETTS|nr:transmembrane protein, putative [Tetrahymena thermophila SB210]EAR89459.2 transmembrane protein, putative [Tetrahymena thermophila SB210]|eukprot:XP_001009704.2 transmembrane protein, putative [Tetrahymena thermophila SB210]
MGLLMEIRTRDIIDLSISIFTYLYITYLLCRTLGNFDLIRKIKSFEQLKEYINFNEQNFYNNKSYKNKLDILCPSSLEAWDNSRKLLLQHEKSLLIDLEVAYICLTFQYLFVTVISASGLYEFYWIIPKQSILLSDSVVIMSTLNFVFLSIFFLYRFYKGTQFNECFDNLQLSTVELLDVRFLNESKLRFCICNHNQKDKKDEQKYNQILEFLFGLNLCY